MRADDVLPVQADIIIMNDDGKLLTLLALIARTFILSTGVIIDL